MFELQTVLIGFFIIICLLHLLLISPEYRNSKKWIKSDYIWIGFMMLGLISSVTPGRKFISKRDLPYLEGRIIGTYRSALSNASFYDRYFNQSFVYPQWQYNTSDTTKYLRAGEWYKAFHDTLKYGYKSKKWRLYVKEQVKTGTNYPPEFKRVQKEALMYLAKVDSLSFEVTKLNKKLKDTDIELVLMLFSPWLLAIGLAIRITKVSVIIYENRKNK